MIDTILLNAIGSTPKGVIALVHDVDIDNVSYKNGCQGRPKTLTEKDSQGTVIKTTIFRYTDSTYPNTMTEYEVI